MMSRTEQFSRCDRCGAAAYVHAEFASGSELHFCAHHGHQYDDKLRKVAVVIHDESGRLIDVPAMHTTPVHPSLRWRV
jgi:hypothetical protein